MPQQNEVYYVLSDYEYQTLKAILGTNGVLGLFSNQGDYWYADPNSIDPEQLRGAGGLFIYLSSNQWGSF